MDKICFLLPIEFGLVLSIWGLPLDGSLHATLRKPPANPSDSSRGKLQRLGDPIVTPGWSLWAFVGLQKNACSGLFTHRGLSPTDEFEKPSAIIIGQFNTVILGITESGMREEARSLTRYNTAL
ncbi:hypothetical protein [Salinibacter ruber]|uniref:hypothetical protein n=1 Tax=Salinibacter ruber TaxID=146919 RepID=UPI0021681681|nr:hypothetical protein [Salinibacter ruber]MCS3698403.1 hypothetical protein [Salinibacter ruber]